METIVLIFILVALAIVLIVLASIVDRLKILESLGLPSASSASAAEEYNRDPRFRGLSGVQLWDLMCGKAVEGFTEQDAHMLRSRYEMILTKHIEKVFTAGKSGAKSPGSHALISGMRGDVDSYIPPNHANSLYEAGRASQTSPVPVELYDKIDETVETLFTRTDLRIQESFAERLLGPAPQDAGNEIVGDGNDTTAETPAGQAALSADNAQTSAPPSPGDNPRSQ